jgi:hypothetical protein
VLKAFRDWRRGYYDADIASARQKVDALPVRVGRPAYVTLRLKEREWRAFFGEGMGLADGMRSALGCHLPPVMCEISDRGVMAHPGDLDAVKHALGIKR